LDRGRGELDRGLLDREVHRRVHAVELVQPALDAVCARGARHAGDGKLETLHRYLTSWVNATVCTAPLTLNCRNRRYAPVVGNVASKPTASCSVGWTCRNARSPSRSATRWPPAPR